MSKFIVRDTESGKEREFDDREEAEETHHSMASMGMDVEFVDNTARADGGGSELPDPSEEATLDLTNFLLGDFAEAQIRVADAQAHIHTIYANGGDYADVDRERLAEVGSAIGRATENLETLQERLDELAERDGDADE